MELGSQAIISGLTVDRIEQKNNIAAFVRWGMEPADLSRISACSERTYH